MVEHYLGEETFRQGVHNYLAAHLYANATAEDFWNAQTATSHQPVDKIMDSFVDQPGCPSAHLQRPLRLPMLLSARAASTSPHLRGRRRTRSKAARSTGPFLYV